MTPDELKTWRAIMDWTQKSAAQAFGMSLSQYQEMEAGKVEISKRTELACGATANGIFDYQPRKEDNDE